MSKKQVMAEIIRHTSLSDGIFDMTLKAEEIAKEAKAGQFISVYLNNKSKILPRPISICGIDKEAGTLRIVYRTVGDGTKELSDYKEGEMVKILGPLGNGFTQKDKKAILIGGGIGIPPMLELMKQLDCDKTAVLGYRDNDMFLKDEFEAVGDVVISTEDGSFGTKGNVIDAIKEQGVEGSIIYACGPTPMLRGIKAYAEEMGIEAQISMEERMACGIGACLACVCKSKDVDSHSHVHNQTCLQRWASIRRQGGGTIMNLSVDIAGVTMKNPVTTGSGTFGSGEEFSEFVDLSKLGAVTTKGVANVPWPGNPVPRVAEVYGGMLNAIGLQNPGIDVFVERDIPYLKKAGATIIVNVCGKSEKDYLEVVERLADQPVDLLEINVSCPNVKEGGIAFGQDPKALYDITKAVKAKAKQPIIMKLSPNVTDITEMAKAAVDAGSDALSLINTLTGMKIDIERRDFVLANKTGGMSGPAIKPVAVRMVYQVANAVDVPIIGMGGISTAEDALEFIMAGATAVSVGTANFINPATTLEVVDGIKTYMERHQINDINELIGCVK